MNDIQDDAYSEACEEIERLKKLLNSCSAKCGEYSNLLVKAADRIERHQGLLARAADTLEKWNVRHRFTDLIDEIKRATK